MPLVGAHCRRSRRRRDEDPGTAGAMRPCENPTQCNELNLGAADLDGRDCLVVAHGGFTTPAAKADATYSAVDGPTAG